MDAQNVEAVAQDNSLLGQIKRHWRGEMSLSYSFWGNMVALSILAEIVSSMLNGLLPKLLGGGVKFENISLPYAILMGAIAVWQIVGVWRSANRHMRDGKSKIWGIAAQGVCGFLAIAGAIYWGTYFVNAVKLVIA